MVSAVTIFFLDWVRDEYRSDYDNGRGGFGKKSQQTPQQGAELAQNCDCLQAVFGCVYKKYLLQEEFVKLFTNRGVLTKTFLLCSGSVNFQFQVLLPVVRLQQVCFTLRGS